MDLPTLLHNHIENGTPINLSAFIRQWEQEALDPRYRYNPTQVLFQIFCYFLTDKLSEARLLYKRLPNELKNENPNNSELLAAWAVGKFLIKNDLARAQKKIFSTHWRDGRDLATILKRKLTQDAKNLIAKTYVSIQINKAAELLGVSDFDLPSTIRN